MIANINSLIVNFQLINKYLLFVQNTPVQVSVQNTPVHVNKEACHRAPKSINSSSFLPTCDMNFINTYKVMNLLWNINQICKSFRPVFIIFFIYSGYQFMSRDILSLKKFRAFGKSTSPRIPAYLCDETLIPRVVIT